MKRIVTMDLPVLEKRRKGGEVFTTSKVLMLYDNIDTAQLLKLNINGIIKGHNRNSYRVRKDEKNNSSVMKW